MTAPTRTTLPTVPAQRLQARRRSWTPPPPAREDLPARLADIGLVVADLGYAEQLVVDAVLRARAAGATWEVLGGALGIGARAAWQRYSAAAAAGQ